MSSRSNGAGLSRSSLVVRLQSAQAEAWQGFLRVYGPLIYSWCRSRWHLPAPDAADVLQDVVTRVLETIADFRGDNFAGWLWSITRSRAVNFWKKNPHRAVGGSDAQRRLAEVADPRPAQQEAAEEIPEFHLDQLPGVLQRALENVRQRAAPTSWQAFWQVTVLGRKPADVAQDLGLSVNGVYIANSRILCRLRQELGEAPT